MDVTERPADMHGQGSDIQHIKEELNMSEMSAGGQDMSCSGRCQSFLKSLTQKPLLGRKTGTIT